ncbi:MAG: hypothetical protein ACK4TG_09980 [Thermaurantiacus sp.]
MAGTQILFLSVLICVLSIALAMGGRQERIAAVAMGLAAVASPLVQDPAFVGLNIGLLVVDFALLVVLGWLVFASDRYWPMFAAGFHLTGTMVHSFPGLMARLHPDAYADAIAVWAYPVLLSLLAGTLLEARTVKGPA